MNYFSRTTLFRLLCLALISLASRPELWAEIKAEPASIDFGRQRQQKTASGTVKLTNTGKTPLTITHVAADCSCTAGTPEKRDLAPGESTNVDITFDTRNYQGEVHRRVLVETTSGEVTVQVQALVSAYDHWSLPAQIAIFPPSNKGTEANTSVALTYIGDGTPAEVKEIKSSVPWLKAEVTERAAGTTTLTLTKVAGAPAGNHQPKLTVYTTDTHEPEIDVPVFATVLSSLTLQPNPVLLPSVKVGTPAVLPVSLSGWEASVDPRFEIEGGQATLRKRDRSDVLFDVSVTPTQLGTSTQLLRIFAGDSVEAEIPVIIRAEE